MQHNSVGMAECSVKCGRITMAFVLLLQLLNISQRVGLAIPI